jgi:hypothetical protein
MKTALVIAMLLSTTLAASASVPCQTKSGGHGYSYRVIDGKKCWYQGRGLAKRELLWVSVSREARAKTIRAKARTREVEMPRIELVPLPPPERAAEPVQEVASRFVETWEALPSPAVYVVSYRPMPEPVQGRTRAEVLMYPLMILVWLLIGAVVWPIAREVRRRSRRSVPTTLLPRRSPPLQRAVP